MTAARGRAIRPRAGARLFFYGTLLDPDIQERVIGRTLEGAAFAPAALRGFRRLRAAGKWFPLLVPGLRTDRVAGGLALDLTAREIARIIAYEGDTNYGLKRVTVELAGGAAARALVFLPLSAGGLKPSAEPWDLADWQKRVKPRVLRLGLMP